MGQVWKARDTRLDLLILKIIALEPMHGWAMAQRIHQMSGEVLQVGQSALYPALHKLESAHSDAYRSAPQRPDCKLCLKT